MFERRQYSTYLTALHLASAEGHLPIVEALVRNGANVNAEASTGSTPLYEAVSSGFEDVTRILLEYGADFMKAFPKQNRANVLHIASYYGCTAIVKLLLDTGMGIEVKDAELRTPLHYAIGADGEERLWHGNISTIELLLQRNASKDAWDRSGQRPKDLAIGHPCTIVELLLQNCRDIKVEEAIELEHKLWMRKEQEQAKQRREQEVAAERAANRIARLSREAHKPGKGSLHQEVEEAEEAEDHAEKESSRQKKQDAIRQAWAQLRAEAKERSQQAHQTPTPSACSHPGLGWLKCKGKAQCDICGTMCTKCSFRCGDCDIRVCLQCKTWAVRSNA